MSENTDESVWSKARGGRHVVLTLYAVIVAAAGLFGFLIGYYGGSALDPIDLGFIVLPPGPVGFALYGILTVGGTLGLLLALMTYLSTFEKESE